MTITPLELRSAIEAIIYVADEPATLEQIARAAEVDGAGEREQVLARLGLERAPALLGLPGQPHVERIRVGPPEDPGAAVRAPVAVRGTERLEHDHAQAPVGGGVGGGRAGQINAVPGTVTIIIPNGPG